MATTFKGQESLGVTTSTVIYTAAVGTTGTIIGLTVANTTAGTATVSVLKNTAKLVSGAPVPVGGSLIVVGGDQKVVVNAGHTISVVSDVAVDVVISIMEQV